MDFSLSTYSMYIYKTLNIYIYIPSLPHPRPVYCFAINRRLIVPRYFCIQYWSGSIFSPSASKRRIFFFLFPFTPTSLPHPQYLIKYTKIFFLEMVKFTWKIRNVLNQKKNHIFPIFIFWARYGYFIEILVIKMANLWWIFTITRKIKIGKLIFPSFQHIPHLSCKFEYFWKKN